ncbi:hypothetical protein [Algoriphagus sediminis]|uniref:Uncharacterized protein n=1 Tax=Algoriphagus sediminis TaxID=3057113 RepID=A0ABT7YHL0_9BACT|nr:hypothetical protein [Algoriphagus sediminis]MDN3205664.1 hypothetical protein [Algoriphagus sediminis]
MEDKKIKFRNKAHKKNNEGIMKARIENKQKLDFETMHEQIKKNSKD